MSSQSAQFSGKEPAAENPESAPQSGFSSIAAIEAHLSAAGAQPCHIRQVWRAWLCDAPWPGAAGLSCSRTRGRIPALPRRAAERLPEIRRALERVLTLRSRHPGADPESERLLVTLSDGQTVEEVLLPRQGVCISTQLGCAVGCVFCMTGKGGLVRQLTDLEIAAQAALARRLRPETRKAVFMGMGEPSHNLANVLSAVKLLAHHGNFGHKNLVISTVGDPRLFDALDALGDADPKPALAVSLHSAFDEKRRELLPRGARMTAAGIAERAERWARRTGYPIQYQWTLMAGINDGDEEAERLIALLRGRYAMVNFIPVNAVPGSPYQRPPRERAAALARMLKRAGVFATLRDSAAQDVDGGCGQLRARVLSEAARERAEAAAQRKMTSGSVQ